MAMAMAMAMAMMSCERKSLSMPLSQDETHTVIGDITDITRSNSENDQLLVQATSARFDGRMPDILEVEIWRTVLLWMFLLSLVFSSLYFVPSLDLSPVHMASARVFTTSGDKSCGSGVTLCAGSAEWLPYSTDRFWDYGFVNLRALNGNLIVVIFFLLLYGIMQPRGSAPKVGDNVMARLQVTCLGPGNTGCI
jgi:hypothetical protein